MFCESMQWGCSEWDMLYRELPSRQLKVKVRDRTLVQTTDSERTCVAPSGLQGAIDQLVGKAPQGRAFVRYSMGDLSFTCCMTMWPLQTLRYGGCGESVRRGRKSSEWHKIFFKCLTPWPLQDSADSLAVQVGVKVHEMADGIGRPPSL